MIMLNPRLVERQGLSEDDVQAVLGLHEELEDIFDVMKQLSPDNPEELMKLRQLVIVVEQLEFDLQKAWRFEQSRDHHTWWYRAPHCQCPKMDNDDAFGTKYHIRRDNCPLHGWK